MSMKIIVDDISVENVSKTLVDRAFGMAKNRSNRQIKKLYDKLMFNPTTWENPAHIYYRMHIPKIIREVPINMTFHEMMMSENHK